MRTMVFLSFPSFPTILPQTQRDFLSLAGVLAQISVSVKPPVEGPCL